MQHVDLRRRQSGGRRLWTGHLLTLILITVLAAAGVSLWQAQVVAENRARIAAGESQVAETRRAVETFARENPEVSDNGELREHISTLESERQTGLQRLRSLLQTSGVRALSYHDFLSTLARHRIDGAWLTRFRLENDENRGVLYVTLSGLTEDTELLPDYLTGLRAGGLQSVSFNNLTVNRQAENSDRRNLFRFQLSTRNDAKALAQAMNDESGSDDESAAGSTSDSGRATGSPAPASGLPLDNLPPGLLNSLMQGGSQ